MKATRFVRIPFPTWGHRVTDTNIDVVAAWCKGTVVRNPDRSFILVPVANARNPRAMQARPGDWVLKATRWGKTTFKVYPQASLENDFFILPGDWGGDEELDYDEDPIEEEPPSLPLQLVRPVPVPGNHRPDMRRTN